MNLAENARLTGKTKADFASGLDEFQKGLEHRCVDGKSLVFGYFEEDTENEILISVFPAGEFKGFKRVKFNKLDYPDELVEELKLIKLCLIEDNKIVFVSSNCEFSEMRIKGDFFLDITREAVIAIARAAVKRHYTLISRSDKGLKKVYAFRSVNYLPINQDVIFNIISEIESSCCTDVSWEKWEIHSCYTEVIVSLPDVFKEINSEYILPSNYLPCLLVKTSDTGDSSLMVYEAWKTGKNSYILGNKVSEKHWGKFDESAFVDKVRTCVFDKLYEFPKMLTEAALIDVSPFGISLTSSGASLGRKINAENWKNTIRNISRYIGLTKEVGKKTEKEIVRSIVDDFDAGTFVTLYDAISEFLSLPERLIGMKPSKYQSLQKCITKAAYYRPSFEEIPVVA